jgi:tetratricopeptide (TPR) repeat protein
MINSLNRCFFDAEHGRVNLALTRLKDLDDDFPHQAHVVYAEGLVRKDYLGQGIAARALFEKAYWLDTTYGFAACNACKLAMTEKQFQEWAQNATSASPRNDPVHQFVKHVNSQFKQGIPFWHILAGGCQEYISGQVFGEGAALAEIVLETGKLGQADEVAFRKARAESLRALDKAAQIQRDTVMEFFPPDERLALSEAVKELDRALSLDQYDATLWNFKSAWSYLLAQYQESIQYADKALSIRPFGYPKPYINKAIANWQLKRYSDAQNYAKIALKQSEKAMSKTDVEQSLDLISKYSTVPEELTVENGEVVEPIFERIADAAQVTCNVELGQMKASMDGLVKGVARRVNLLGDAWNPLYIQLMAELLSDFCPETVFCIIANLGSKNLKAYEHCLNAALFVTAKSNGVAQRDAARFLALMFLNAVNLSKVRRGYRRAVLETSSAATDELSQLNAILQKELWRINPVFAKLIVEQEPVDAQGRMRAMAEILSRF